MADNSWDPVCNRQERDGMGLTEPQALFTAILRHFQGSVSIKSMFHKVLRPELGKELQGRIQAMVEGELL